MKPMFQAIFCCVFASLIFASDVEGQVVIRGGIFEGRLAVPAETGSGSSGSQEVVGAVLKTDPDLEALLDKANRHAEDGNYRVATRLWQAVLERSGDSLYSEDEKIYYSIGDQVEQMLAELPSNALGIYRVTADASARQILTEADDPNDVAALMRVAGNYFVSSEGDDAAFRLGCLYLDRHDFSGALRMLRKVASQHPDPSIPLDEIYARIAICHAFMGNRELAQDALDRGRGFGADSVAVDAVERSLSELAPTNARTAAMSQWLVPLGNERRMAAMPELPESSFVGDQVCKWSFFVPPRDDRFLNRPDTEGTILHGKEASGALAASTRNPVERRMIKEWAEKGWRPSGHLLFDDSRIFFKAAADVVAFDRQKIADSMEDETEFSKGEVRQYADWRSIWRNVFEVDPATMRMEQLLGSAVNRRLRIRGRSGTTQQPTKSMLAVFPRSMHFEDLIHQQMAVHDGVLYSIEGNAYDGRSSHPASGSRVRHGWNVVMRRTRQNFLTAYEKETGRMLWRLPRVNAKESPSYDPAKKNVNEQADEEWITSGGMMAAPVKFANLLILPVNQNGAIHLYGIDPSDEGKTVWSAFLCDEPESGSVASAPINLSIDGSDLFASCGTGVLFVIDPTTGKIRFAKRYDRTGEPNAMMQRFPNSMYTNFDGWSSDMILPNGRELICFRSDTEEIEAIDRNDGSMIWRTGLRPYGLKVDHIIGVWDDLLYLGGKRTIIAIDLNAEGYIAWGGEPLFEDRVTTGRGMVTPQGVFVPVGNSIWRFELKGKKGRAHVLNQIEAFLGTEAPVGNLYSDGQRIWVHGASRLYALSPKED